MVEGKILKPIELTEHNHKDRISLTIKTSKTIKLHVKEVALVLSMMINLITLTLESMVLLILMMNFKILVT